MKRYDVVVVGSGTGGQTAAHALNTRGLKVAVVESSDRPGGICALAGCQAKKYFYEAAETVARSRHLADKGIAQTARGDWAAVLEQKSAFTENVPDGTIDGLMSAGIDFIEGRARFAEDGSLSVDGESLPADHIILATGARPMPLPIEGIEHAIDSGAFLDLTALPRRIVFIGGGFISFEFAHFAARLGPPESRITILEAADRPLGPFDGEMVNLLISAGEAEGIRVETSVKITSITRTGDELTVHTAAGGAYPADLVVQGAGRVPEIDSLNLDAAGIRYSRRGIEVTDGMRTTSPAEGGVFAVGDCAATVQLARVADYEAQVAARNIVAAREGGEPARIDYRTVPAVLFTYPQYAMMGVTEASLLAAGTPYRRSFGKGVRWPTYRRVGMEHAAFKILVGKDDQILGAHILSDNATGMINTLRMAAVNKMGVGELYRHSIMTPYPSRESDLLYMLRPFLPKDALEIF